MAENDVNVEKGLVAYEVTLLQEKLNAITLENQTIMAENELLIRKLTSIDKTEGEVYYYLHKKLDNTYQVIENLEKQLHAKDEIHEKGTASLAKGLKDEELAHKRTIKEFNGKLEKAENTIESFKVFKDRKEEMEQKIQQLDSTLEVERQQHAEASSEAERRFVRDKDRIKAEMIIRIKDTKENLLSMTQSQLQDTTKQTILENERLLFELQYQSKEAEKVVTTNKYLLSENANLKHEIKILQGTEQEFAKKCQKYTRTIQKLQTSLQNQDDAPVTEHEADEDAILQIQLADTNKQLESLRLELDNTKTNLEIGENRLSSMLSLQDDTMRYLFSCMNETLYDTASGAKKPLNHYLSTGQLPEITKKEVLEGLLAKMHAYQLQLKNNVFPKSFNIRQSLQNKLCIDLPAVSPTKAERRKKYRQQLDQSYSPGKKMNVSQGDWLLEIKKKQNRGAVLNRSCIDTSPTKRRWENGNRQKQESPSID